MRRIIAGLSLLGLLVGLPLTSRAEPLTYEVEEGDSSLTAGLSAEVTITISVPPRDPGQATFGDAIVIDVEPSGQAIVETGLPKGFDDGAHGLEVQSFALVTQGAPAEPLVTLTDTGLIWNPLIMGMSPATVTAEVHSISIASAAPFEAPLVATGTPDEYEWGPVDATADVGMDVTVTVSVSPTLTNFPLWDGPIGEEDYVVPVEGRFWGDETGTYLTLSANVGELVYDELLEPGGYYTFDMGFEATKIAFGLLATNPTRMPEPSHAALGAAAVASIGLLRTARNRARGSGTQARANPADR